MDKGTRLELKWESAFSQACRGVSTKHLGPLRSTAGEPGLGGAGLTPEPPCPAFPTEEREVGRKRGGGEEEGEERRKRKEGRQEGKKEGRKAGRQGSKEGKKEGRQEGRRTGRKEG